MGERRPVTAAVIGIAGFALLLPAGAVAATARYNATVTRDSSGIVHVRAGDWGSLGYGQGLKMAEDNLCVLADQLVTVRAERSRFFGADGRSVGFSNGANDSNLDSDFFWQRMRTSPDVKKLERAKPPVGLRAEVRDLYDGFAAGYNAFLRSGKLKDPACKGKPWVRPITSRDLLLRGMQITMFGSGARFITGIVAAQPPPSVTPPARARLDADALREQMGDVAEPTLGSNGIGIGSQDTQSGNGMVLANPHFPWRGTERFWLMHLTLPGQYDVMGATLMGFPLVGVGFNKDLAWTHTVSTARRFALYQLKLDPSDPTAYLVDGKSEKMNQETVSVKTKTGTVKHTFFLTRYGLVMNLPDAGYAWTNDTAYAIADPQSQNARAANQYLEMGQAKSVQGLLKVERKWVGTPSFNTIAADRHGNALYDDVGAIPNVPKAKIDSCTPAGLPQVVYAAARLITLDGSRSQCGLEKAAGTPATGVFGAKDMPATIRKDYVENSNDSYWLANPAKPIEGFSPIIGLERTQQGLRTRIGNEMIAARVKGTDGLGKPKFTIPTLQRMWQNDRSLAGELFRDDLAAACRANPTVALGDGSTVDVGPACDVIANYDRTGNLDAKGGWLFSEWLRRVPNAKLYSDPFDAARPIATPGKLNTGDPAILQSLAQAVKDMRDHGIAPDASYGDVQHATRGRKSIPIHGCSTGCFQNISAAAGQANEPAEYGEVISGSSVVLTTELTPKGPRSEGILTYSQATDPTSPWFSNLTSQFSNKKWVAMAFTPKELARDAGAQTQIVHAR